MSFAPWEPRLRWVARWPRLGRVANTSASMYFMAANSLIAASSPHGRWWTSSWETLRKFGAARRPDAFETVAAPASPDADGVFTTMMYNDCAWPCSVAWLRATCSRRRLFMVTSSTQNCALLNGFVQLWKKTKFLQLKCWFCSITFGSKCSTNRSREKIPFKTVLQLRSKSIIELLGYSLTFYNHNNQEFIPGWLIISKHSTHHREFI